MSSTPQFAIVYLIEGQPQKEATVNTNMDIVESALGGYLSKNVAGNVNVTLTAAEWRNKMLRFFGTLTGNISVIVPVTTRFFLVYNNTSGAFTLTVRTNAGTGVAVTQGSRAILYCDGTDVYSAEGSMVDAAADGTTKGRATFLAADFNSSSGLISLDYANGQAASGAQKGYLTAADWTTFNNKLSSVPDATDTVEGIIELATQSEVNAGTDAVRAVTPDTLAHRTRRVVSLTDAATVTPNADTTDIGVLATLSQDSTIANPSGTYRDGQTLEIRIKSSTARALSFGAKYRGSTSLALPNATSGGNLKDRLLFEYDAADDKWDIMATNFGA